MSPINVNENRRSKLLNKSESDQLEFDIESLLSRTESLAGPRFRIDSKGSILSISAEAAEILELEDNGPLLILECSAIDRSAARKILETAKRIIDSKSSSPSFLKISIKSVNVAIPDIFGLTLKADPKSDGICQCFMERISRGAHATPFKLNQSQILNNRDVAIWSMTEDSRSFLMATPVDKLLETSDIGNHSLNTWLSFVHPEDRARFQKEFKSFLGGEIQSFHMRYRILTQKGRTKRISTFASRRGSSNGQVSDSILGLHRDENNAPNLNRELRLFSILAKKVHSPIVITDQDGRITWFNGAFSEMSGYILSEVVGRKPGDFLQGPLSSRDIIRHMRERIRLKKAFQAEIVNYNKSGEPFWVKIDASPLVDETGKVTHYIAFETNISESKKAQKDITRNEAMYRNLFDNALDAQLIVSKNDQLIIAANQKSSRYFGDKSPLGDHLQQVIERFEGLDLNHINGILRNSNRFQISKEIRLDSSKSVPVDLSICQLSLGDSEVLLLTLRDISEKRALEKQLHHSQKMEAVGKLAGGIAHDFNNLLAGIRGYGELLANSQGPSATECNYIREMLKITDRASCLTSRLLSFSKERSGTSKVTNLNKLIENVFPMLSRILNENIHCETELDLSVPNCIIDPAQTEQIIMNLFVNAQEASDKPDPRVLIRTRSVELRGDEKLLNGTPPSGLYTVFEVEDNGQGMAPEMIEKIFEPFFTTKDGAGTGLGLSIVYGIVNSLNGFLNVFSIPGHGTKFTIYFPSAFEMADMDDSDVEESGFHYSEEASTILIAEDQAQVREILELSLGQSGYNLLIANDGADALSIAEQHDGVIDLLLTDAIMPKIHGTKLAGLIKEKRPEIKVVLMSGLPQCEAFDGNDGEKLIDAYVDKPFSIVKLGSLIKSILASRKSTV